MAFKVGEAYVVINAKLDKLRSAMRRAFQVVRRGVARMAKIGAVAFGALSVAALKFASDVEETQNLFNESMDGMAKQANKFVDTLSSKFGIFPREVQDALGVFNLMLTGMGLGTEKAFEMSKALTQLGFDVASFRNLAPEEAFEKLRAGITGEIEPLKRLGVVINETRIKTEALKTMTKKQAAQMTDAEKVAIRYDLIMQGLSKDSGDLERTQDSFANRLRQLISKFKELLATIGKPFLQPVADIFGKISQKMIDMQPAIAEISEKAKDFVLAFIDNQGGLEGIFKKLVEFGAKVKDTFVKIGESMQKILPTIESITSAVNAYINGVKNIPTFASEAGGLARDVGGALAVNKFNQMQQEKIEKINLQRVLAGKQPLQGGSGKMGTGITGFSDREFMQILNRIEHNTRTDSRI